MSQDLLDFMARCQVGFFVNDMRVSNAAAARCPLKRIRVSCGWAEDGDDNGVLQGGIPTQIERKHVQSGQVLPQKATEVIKFSYVWAAVFFTILSWSVERILSQPIS